MISYIKGSFVSISPSVAIVDVQGVGYEIHISLNTFSAIQEQTSGLLYTHLLIREDAHLLYGFADTKEKEIFLLLLSVSGIGANTARLMLSYMKPAEITTAILHGDARALERIKGIGKKTAERAVLELKDKIGKQPESISVQPGTDPPHMIKQDALEALVALGINRQQADSQVTKHLASEPTIALEDLIKKVLKGL